MNWMDIILLINLLKELVWVIPYELWQFGVIPGTESFWTRVISFADLTEWIVFVISRFFPYGYWGTVCLGAFYTICIITLILQYVFADWEGNMWRVKTVFWIGFYIIMILIDIAHIDVFQIIADKINTGLLSTNGLVKTLGLSNCIEIIILLVSKLTNRKRKRKVRGD